MKKHIFLVITILSFAFFTAQAQMSILLVNDNDNDIERVEVIKTAIDNSGYTYAFWDATTWLSGPSFEFMEGFNLVIWYTGNDGGSLYFWNGDETENQNIKYYVDGGGMLWVQGLDFLFDKYPETPTEFLTGEFVYDYLGISNYFGQSHLDDGVWSDGVPQLDVVEGNSIFTVDPLLWTYDAMWFVDALEKTSVAQYIYQMGPENYDLDDYYPAIYLEKGDGKVLTFAFETARIDTQENTDLLFGEGLGYFEQFAEPGIPAEEIIITSEGGVFFINENFGSLQLYAEVLPEDASIPFVHWSVSSEGVSASIDQNGLLQSSGTNNGNGTILVIAEALDGSGVTASIEVEISGQGTEFTVLLVNDNANSNSGGLTRYLVIDTSLNNLGYVYSVYNTVTTGDFPDYQTLSGYDAVLWYTGNDGNNLKLWDVSDTTGAVNQNLKFNEPLMDYINGGGIVWLQGLDFIYDIYGGAIDFFASGDFMYDFMGIEAYVAQSHADGDDLPQLDVVPGNPICTFSPITWVYAEGLWYADALEITDNAEGIYTMGPDTYIYSDYYSGVYTQPGDGHLFSLTVETARIDTREHTDEFVGDVLDYFQDITTDIKNEKLQTGFTNIKNYPNPVSDIAVISYSLNEPANIHLSIVDIMGRQVFFKDYGTQQDGNNKIEISVKNLGLQAGIYSYVLNINNKPTTGKLVIKKL